MANEKLNPPLLDGKINAQVGDHIVVPFTMNRAVGLAQFRSVTMMIKTVSTGVEIGSFTCDKSSLYFKDKHYVATFLNAGVGLQIGQYYKIQLAYCHEEDGTIGFYSTVATFKYTAQPEVTIKGL